MQIKRKINRLVLRVRFRWLVQLEDVYIHC